MTCVQFGSSMDAIMSSSKSLCVLLGNETNVVGVPHTPCVALTCGREVVCDVADQEVQTIDFDAMIKRQVQVLSFHIESELRGVK